MSLEAWVETRNLRTLLPVSLPVNLIIKLFLSSKADAIVTGFCVLQAARPFLVTISPQVGHLTHQGEPGSTCPSWSDDALHLVNTGGLTGGWNRV